MLLPLLLPLASWCLPFWSFELGEPSAAPVLELAGALDCDELPLPLPLPLLPDDDDEPVPPGTDERMFHFESTVLASSFAAGFVEALLV